MVIHFLVLLGVRSVSPQFLPKPNNGVGALSALLAARPIEKRMPQSNQAAVAMPPPTKLPESVGRRVSPQTLNTVADFPQFSRSTVASDRPAETVTTPPILGIQNKNAVSGRQDDLSEVKNAEVKVREVKNAEVKNAEGLGEYRLGLAREARRFKRYPSVARENAWTGVVVLMIQGAASSAVPTVSIDQSSGHAVLDAQALEMLEKATRLAPLPVSLMGKRFAISLPIHYRLDD
ncbi:MAG: TonB family protein [Betaproteobacteria bacterium]|nr:TonB family protein [Betaproteobacteria bacterium]